MSQSLPTFLHGFYTVFPQKLCITSKEVLDALQGLVGGERLTPRYSSLPDGREGQALNRAVGAKANRLGAGPRVGDYVDHRWLASLHRGVGAL